VSAYRAEPRDDSASHLVGVVVEWIKDGERKTAVLARLAAGKLLTVEGSVSVDWRDGEVARGADLRRQG
jgi:hypothetical protein